MEDNYESNSATGACIVKKILQEEKSSKLLIFKLVIIILPILTLLCGAQYVLCLNIIDKIESIMNKASQNIDNINSESEQINNGTNNLMGKLKQETTMPNKTPYNENYLTIINRTEWKAINSSGYLHQFNRPVDTVIIAHTSTQKCTDFESCKLQVNMLQLFYMQMSYFQDIGYNFLIGGDGVVYEGIGWKYIGYHTKGHNDHSIGIAFIGNYQNERPTENQLSAAILLLHYGLENKLLDQKYIIKGQRDLLPIVSPGKNLYNRIKKWPHFLKNQYS